MGLVKANLCFLMYGSIKALHISYFFLGFVCQYIIINRNENAIKTMVARNRILWHRDFRFWNFMVYYARNDHPYSTKIHGTICLELYGVLRAQSSIKKIPMQPNGPST